MKGVLLAGGGTAGHVNPLLATAAELRRREPGRPLLAIGTAQGLEADLVPAAGIELAPIPRVPLPRRPSLDLVRLPGRFRAAEAAAKRAITRVGAGVVVGFGGYVSTPAYLAARSMKIPIVVHEGNYKPGLANKVGARWAAETAITFPDTPLGEAVVTGMPLRAAVAELERAGAQVAARTELGLEPDRPTLLVTGGSLGAQRINQTMAGCAAGVLATGAQVLHLTGRGKSSELRESLKGIPGVGRYYVLEYLQRMELAYAAADLAVCRAGAGTVCEMAAVGLPAIYVPLPIGNGEQRLNARDVVRAGGGLLVDNTDFTARWALGKLPDMLTDSATLTAMGEAAASVGIRDGSSRLCNLIEGVMM